MCLFVRILDFGKMAMMAQDIIPNISMFINLLHKKKEFMKNCLRICYLIIMGKDVGFCVIIV